MFRRARLWHPAATAALCWPLGTALGLATEPLWQSGGLAGYLLVPLAVLVVYSVAVWRWPWPSTGFQVMTGSFTTTPRWPNGGMFIVGGYLAAPHLAAIPSGSGTADLVIPLALAASWSLGISLIPALRPRLILTPAGLDGRGLGFPSASWDAITDAELVEAGPRVGRGVRLTLVGPNGRERTETIPRGFAVGYPFLAAAIRHYIDHPEHRTAIGTEAERQRLRSVVGAEPEPDGEPSHV
ncbi:hypothetical protein [Catellatospora sichuanensis]|uniref:hypothetical protein n=1 Tax=Catellatospora sichuanensis TaxID=1969805 RepID=UPI0011822E67|nr:hypothetical protein [Catellatospora sichuanensis]